MHSLFKQYTSLCALAICISLTSASLHAQGSKSDRLCGFSADVQFVESAPRDLFTVRNASTSAWRIVRLNLDLSSSAGQLIFDITAEGAGVEVFQPFRGDGGTASLTAEPSVTDGDQSLVLDFESFESDSEYRFSMDVDDQLTNSELGQIRVSNSEMQGATMTLYIVDEQGTEQQVTGSFDEDNRISMTAGSCG